MAFKEFAAKKVAGVPVLYLALGAVIIFAVVAWKMKTTSGTDTGTPDDGTTDPNGDGGLAPTPNPYDSLDSNGTVTVVQGPLGPTTGNSTTPLTNDDWVRQGAAYLVQQKQVSSATAISALTKFVNGDDRSYDEQALVDIVVNSSGLGLPPDNVGGGGAVGSKPAQTQGTPPLWHVVKGASDNNYQALAILYYGANSAGTKNDLIQGDKANASLGDGPFNPGTKVWIPAYHEPKLYVTPISGMSRQTIAAKNGITVAQLTIFNNGPWYNPKQTFAKGVTLRVG